MVWWIYKVVANRIFHHKDPITGKTIPSREITPRKIKLTEDFQMLFGQGLFWLSKQNLTGEQLRVLIFLISVNEFSNEIYVDHKLMVAHLGLRTQHLSRSIKALVDARILGKTKKVGHLQWYRINPHLVWKGSITSRVQELSNWAPWEDHTATDTELAGFDALFINDLHPSRATRKLKAVL